MKKFLIEGLSPAYLGFSLSLFGDIQCYQWEFYAIIVPFFLLVKLTNFNQK